MAGRGTHNIYMVSMSRRRYHLSLMKTHIESSFGDLDSKISLGRVLREHGNAHSAQLFPTLLRDVFSSDISVDQSVLLECGNVAHGVPLHHSDAAEFEAAEPD